MPLQSIAFSLFCPSFHRPTFSSSCCVEIPKPFCFSRSIQQSTSHFSDFCHFAELILEKSIFYFYFFQKAKMEKEFGFFSEERMLPGSSLGSATVSTIASSNVLTAAPSLDVEISPLPLSPSLKRSRGRPKNASQAPQQQLIKSRSQLHSRPYQSLPAEPAVRLDQ
ncbi:hypothetical protein BCR41DRAFT_62302 [Lobosporangium transversale]|uniref:Uncharacterized protein n=1 Tax=Lobosporangium transversale TaxID=64571 RepID=A0A1Y2GNI8_9FUNG|nr:hypothetical protein BCR41DRAFT_62302 [Lobosporangium transversale]ORZ16196.1 hypothetical protein BCR41DRAFT_62302 [Lobosporangium transversale]|eukprot:XP_021881543.1 hypothetical protein BCR41DRAFT_62302 [Lobosporangium transversale]